MANCALPGIVMKTDAYRTTYRTNGQFRTFDLETGNLVASYARQIEGQDITQWSVAFDRAHDRLVGIGSTLASKSGTLVVWDQRTAAELQRIETPAYRTGQFSLNGRSLSLLGRHDDSLYIYRVGP
jgi:hypothetical protein